MKKILENTGSYLLPIILSSLFPAFLLSEPPSFVHEPAAGVGFFSGAASPALMFSFLSLADKEPPRQPVGNMMALLQTRQQQGCSYKTNLLMQEWSLQRALNCLDRLRAANETAPDFAQGLGVKWEGKWGNIALVFDELVFTVDWTAEAGAHLARVFPLVVKERFLAAAVSIIELQGNAFRHLPAGALIKFFNATTLRFTYPRMLRMQQELLGMPGRGMVLPDTLRLPDSIRKVEFADCDLVKLPDWLEELPYLEELNLAGNPRLVIPPWLKEKIKAEKITLTPDEGLLKRLAMRAPALPSARHHPVQNVSAGRAAGAAAGGLFGMEFVRPAGGGVAESDSDNDE